MAKNHSNRKTYQRGSNVHTPISADKIVRTDIEQAGQQKGGKAETVVDRVVRLPELLTILSIGRSTLFAWVAASKFPAPLRLGIRARGWRLSVVLAFLDSCEAEAERAE